MTDDDDAPPSPEELAEARKLATLVDDMLGGAKPAPVLGSDERVLLETAAGIHAARPLAVARREALLGGVFHRPRRASLLPWSLAALAAAAALIVLFRPPGAPRPQPSASALVGRISAEQAADARARLDVVYADRLSGYRERLLAGGRP